MTIKIIKPNSLNGKEDQDDITSPAAFDLNGGVYAVNLSQNEIVAILKAQSKGFSVLDKKDKGSLKAVLTKLKAQICH